MKVYYRPYKLRPLNKANRLTSLDVKNGVHLKMKIANTENFGDYFPHPELGDKVVEEFLEKFKYQDQEYEQKVFYFLLNDHRLRDLPKKSFFNHQLWDGKADISSSVIKYKIKDHQDFGFLPATKKGIKVRLDANGLFKMEELKSYLKGISALEMIDYLEDPCNEEEWSGLSVPLARDFVNGTPCNYIIHKASARFFPKNEEKVIFSSYMGSDLGRWQTYCELLDKGNLEFNHGILTPGLYEEDKLKFNGSYKEGFIPNNRSVKEMYDDLSSTEWKLLCSI